jgi:hypothetical protein
MQGRKLTVLNWERLKELAGFDPPNLHHNQV